MYSARAYSQGLTIVLEEAQYLLTLTSQAFRRVPYSSERHP
jgi:hypothetical protein